MHYRPLGKTGLCVSALGYGASPLGSVFRPIDEAEGIRTVHRALDLGVNFIDVSPYYGLTKAETVLGRALNLYAAPSDLTGIRAGTIANTGGSQAHENDQPSLVLNFCIALQGLFPSRN